MQTHPFIESVANRVAGIALTVVAFLVYTGLLYRYGQESGWVAAVDSLVSIGLLAVAGFLYGYIDGTLHTLQVQILSAILALGISLAGAFELQILLVREAIPDFIDSIPLRVVFGALCWIILLQWYRINRIYEQQLEEPVEKDEKKGAEETETIQMEDALLDRISVKDGTRIHIIHIDDLLYIQASGDYVTLFTFTGQYVKEQTMKYFETHLSSALFIRIHRSCIVNAEQIVRVELFGKENYQVRLKNGVCLRASLSGYRLLKERLSL